MATQRERVIDRFERGILKELSTGPKFRDELLSSRISETTLDKKLKSLIERNLVGWRQLGPKDGVKGRKRLFFARNQGGFFKMSKMTEQLVYLEPVDWKMAQSVS